MYKHPIEQELFKKENVQQGTIETVTVEIGLTLLKNNFPNLLWKMY